MPARTNQLACDCTAHRQAPWGIGGLLCGTDNSKIMSDGQLVTSISRCVESDCVSSATTHVHDIKMLFEASNHSRSLALDVSAKQRLTTGLGPQFAVPSSSQWRRQPRTGGQRSSHACSTCAARVHHVCTTCAPRVHHVCTTCAPVFSRTS